MHHIKIPLIRHDNKVEFDIDKIESRKFVKAALDLHHDDFKFKSFGYCLDTFLFYIIIDNYSEPDMIREETYRFTLSEINESFFVSDVRMLTEKESISCEFSLIS